MSILEACQAGRLSTRSALLRHRLAERYQATLARIAGTVAILAQGTSLALASQQAFLCGGSILAGAHFGTINSSSSNIAHYILPSTYYHLLRTTYYYLIRTTYHLPPKTNGPLHITYILLPTTY